MSISHCRIERDLRLPNWRPMPSDCAGFGMYLRSRAARAPDAKSSRFGFRSKIAGRVLSAGGCANLPESDGSLFPVRRRTAIVRDHRVAGFVSAGAGYETFRTVRGANEPRLRRRTRFQRAGETISAAKSVIDDCAIRIRHRILSGRTFIHKPHDGAVRFGSGKIQPSRTLN